MKLSQNKQILLVVVVFGLFAGGIYYDEIYRKKNRLTETIQPKNMTIPKETFHLFGDYYFNGKYPQNPESIRNFEFDGKEYYGVFVASVINDTVKYVVGTLYNKETKEEGIPVNNVMNLLKKNYYFVEIGEVFQLYENLRKLEVLNYDLRCELEKGYKESENSLFTKNFLKNFHTYIFISPDKKVLVELHYTKNNMKAYQIYYYSFDERIQEINRKKNSEVSSYSLLMKQKGL